jgi:hypothetical protein
MNLLHSFLHFCHGLLHIPERTWVHLANVTVGLHLVCHHRWWASSDCTLLEFHFLENTCGYPMHSSLSVDRLAPMFCLERECYCWMNLLHLHSGHHSHGLVHVFLEEHECILLTLRSVFILLTLRSVFILLTLWSVFMSSCGVGSQLSLTQEP